MEGWMDGMGRWDAKLTKSDDSPYLPICEIPAVSLSSLRLPVNLFSPVESCSHNVVKTVDVVYNTRRYKKYSIKKEEITRLGMWGIRSVKTLPLV
jgi:hypothetical protein